MAVSNKVYGITMLGLSVLSIFYMFFMLIIVPILPLNEDNILSSLSQTPILLVSGICGLIFCGGLSVFTVFVMMKGKWRLLWTNRK